MPLTFSSFYTIIVAHLIKIERYKVLVDSITDSKSRPMTDFIKLGKKERLGILTLPNGPTIIKLAELYALLEQADILDNTVGIIAFGSAVRSPVVRRKKWWLWGPILEIKMEIVPKDADFLVITDRLEPRFALKTRAILEHNRRFVRELGYSVLCKSIVKPGIHVGFRTKENLLASKLSGSVIKSALNEGVLLFGDQDVINRFENTIRKSDSRIMHWKEYQMNLQVEVF